MNRTLVTTAALAALAALGTRAAVVAARPQSLKDVGSEIRPPTRIMSVRDPSPAEPPSFADAPPAAQATPPPKPEEWRDAPPVRLDHDVDACHAYRVREWVKIHCAGLPFAGASLLAGTREGVGIWIDPPRDDDTMKTLRGAELIFPVRRGDGRLFQIGQFGEGYDGPVAWNVAFTVSEQWIEGDKAPALVVR